MIRDLPAENRVEFWLNSNNGTTFSASLPWGYTVNGSTWNGTFNYAAGAGWRRLGNFTVTGSQTLTFRLGSTGTGGFGGPTTFNQFINRQSVPPAPTTPALSEITSSSMKVIFHSQGDGQSPIIRWDLGYGTDPNGAPLPYTVSTGTTVVTGLISGATYYFWARGVNALGVGPWSARGSATTLRIPGTNSLPIVTDVGQTTARIQLQAGDTGGDPITLYQFGWSTNSALIPVDPNIVSVIPTGSLLPTVLTGLPPGTTLYFRSRTRNSVGWSSWNGGATVARTIAGARVKVGFIYKEAIPYVKVAGVWKLARPWARIAGVWKESL